MRRLICLFTLALAGCNSGALPATTQDLSLSSDLATSGCVACDVGAACGKDADCAAGECIVQAPFTRGYCSARIGECPAAGGTGPCPMGSACINPGLPATGGADYCVKRCTADTDCRMADGYRCCPTVQGHTGPFCYPTALCP